MQRILISWPLSTPAMKCRELPMVLLLLGRASFLTITITSVGQGYVWKFLVFYGTVDALLSSPSYFRYRRSAEAGLPQRNSSHEQGVKVRIGQAVPPFAGRAAVAPIMIGPSKMNDLSCRHNLIGWESWWCIALPSDSRRIETNDRGVPNEISKERPHD